MANSSSEDETDTLPERPTSIHPYRFEPVRQDFERVPEHRVSFDMRYSMGFAAPLSTLSLILCMPFFSRADNIQCCENLDAYAGYAYAVTGLSGVFH